MAQFEIMSPDGRKFIVEGDEAPTESDLDSIFSEVSPAPSAPPLEAFSPDVSRDITPEGSVSAIPYHGAPPKPRELPPGHAEIYEELGMTPEGPEPYLEGGILEQAKIALQSGPARLGEMGWGVVSGVQDLASKSFPFRKVVDPLRRQIFGDDEFDPVLEVAQEKMKERGDQVEDYETIGRATKGPQIVRDVVGTGVSILPSLAAAPAGFLAMVGAAGAQSYGHAYAEAKKRGMTNKQAQVDALVKGTITAAITRAFGQRGLEVLSKPASRMPIAKRLKEIGKQGGFEATEETFDETLQMAYDVAYRHQDLSVEDALYGAMVAFISGGLFGGGAATIQVADQIVRDRMMKPGEAKAFDEVSKNLTVTPEGVFDAQGRPIRREPQTPGEQDAGQVQQTSPIHEPVPAESFEGEGQVPAQGRGAEVQPEAVADPQEAQSLTPRMRRAREVNDELENYELHLGPREVWNATEGRHEPAREATERERQLLGELETIGRESVGMEVTPSEAVPAQDQKAAQKSRRRVEKENRVEARLQDPDPIGKDEAQELATSLLGPNAYAKTDVNDSGEVFRFEVGYRRKGKPGQGGFSSRLSTPRGTSQTSFREALAEAVRYQKARNAGTRQSYLVWRKANPQNEKQIDLLESASEGSDVPVEVITRPLNPNEPFAGQIATIDRRSGRILINPNEFLAWAETIPPGRLEEAIESLLAEERIHLAVDDDSALAYWNSLSAVEKAINTRRYTGRWRGSSEVSERNMAHEAIRFRLQQLARMTPREIADSAGRERWTTQLITALESVIRTIRRHLGRGISATQDAILNRMIVNLRAANIGLGAEPGAIGRAGMLERLRALEAAQPTQWVEPPQALPNTHPLNADTGPEVAADLGLKWGGVQDHATGKLMEFTIMRPGDMEGFTVYVEPPATVGRLKSRLIEKEMEHREALDELPAPKPGTVRLYHGSGGAEGAGMGSSWFTRNPQRAADFGPNLTYVDVPEEVARTAQQAALSSGSGTALDYVLPGEAAKGAKEVPKKIEQKIYDLEPSAIRKKRKKEAPSGQIEFESIAPAEPETPDTPEAKAAKERRRRLGPQLKEVQTQMFMPPAPRSVPQPRPEMTEFGYTPVAPAQVEEDAVKHILETQATKRVRVKKKGRQQRQVVIADELKPSFPEFVKLSQARYGGQLKPGQLREIWGAAVWKSLLRASGSQLEALRKGLKLERNVGGRAIVDPGPEVYPRPRQKVFTEIEPGPGVEISRQLRRAIERKGEPTARPQGRRKYRNLVISAIGTSLIEQSLEGRQRVLRRKSVSPEDLSVKSETSEGIFRKIQDMESRSVSGLRSILSDNARVSGAPVSVTKRLVAMRDKRTGKVELVSVYPERKGVMKVVDPAKLHLERPNVNLEDALRRYQPIYSVLLDEPVQNFHQRFDSVESFMGQFGREAWRRSRMVEDTPPTETPNVRVPRPGIFQFERGMIEESSKRPITEAEAGALLDHIYDEVGELDSQDDVLLAMDSIRVKYKMGDLSGRDYAVISALGKIGRQSAFRRGLTPESVMDVAARDIFQMAKESDTREEFVQRVLARFRPPTRPERAPGLPEPRVPTTRLESQARELTMPGFRPPIPPTGPQDPMRGYVAPEDARRQQLTPEERAEVERRADLEYPIVENFYESIARSGTYARPASEVTETGPRVPGREFVRGVQREEFIERAGELASERSEIERDEPAAVRRAVEQGVGVYKKFIHDPAKGFGRWYSGWITDNLRRFGGVASRIAADLGDKMIDRQKQLYGELAVDGGLDDAKAAAGGTVIRAAGQVPSPTRMRATAWLNQIKNPISNRTAVANVVDAIEGRLVPPKYVAEVLVPAQFANLAIGTLYEPVTPGFKARGFFQRNWTAYGFDFFSRGEGAEWDAYTRDLALLNKDELERQLRDRLEREQPTFEEIGWDIGKIDYDWMNRTMTDAEAIETTRDFFRAFRDELLKEVPDGAAMERVNQDFSRFFPRVLTHIRTDMGWQQVIHTELFNYLENAAQKATHIVAFREQFPMTKAGRKKFAELAQEVRRELPNEVRGDFKALIRTLQGRPTDTYNGEGQLAFLAPGKTLGDFFRGLNSTVIQLVSKMVLTGQMITQTPETLIGAGPASFGMRNYLRGMGRLGQLWAETEKMGQINRMMYDFSINPNGKTRTLFRLAGNTLSKGFAINFLNELQGRLNASVARVAVERIAEGKLTNWEKRQFPETLRKMHFTKQQAEKIMRGDDPELMGMFMRRAPAWLSAENKSLVEGSRLGANRAFNSVFRFMMYPMMKMNQFRQNLIRLTEAWEDGTPAEKRAAVEGMARFMFYTTAQGASLVLLSALAFGGVYGLRIALKEAEDEPFEFLTEGLLGALGGPFYLIWRTARFEGLLGLGEQATRMAFPYSVAIDAMESFNGIGQYRDMTAWDRIGKFVSQKTPGLRVAQTALSMWGLSQKDEKLEASIKAYYRWKRDKYGWVSVDSRLEEDERKEFRIAMRKVVEALQDGDRDAYYDALSKAIGSTPHGKDPRLTIGASLRGMRRKILSDGDGSPLGPDELDELTERIGKEAVDRLSYYAAMLDHMAAVETGTAPVEAPPWMGPYDE